MSTPTTTLTAHQLPVLTATAEQFSTLIELIALAQHSAVEIEMKLIRNLCGRKRITLKLLDGIQLILEKHEVAVLSGALKRRQHETVTLLPASAVSSSSHSTSRAVAHSQPQSAEPPEMGESSRNASPISEPSSPRRPWWRRFWQTASVLLLALCLISSTATETRPRGQLAARTYGHEAQPRPSSLRGDHEASKSPARPATLQGNARPAPCLPRRRAGLTNLRSSSASSIRRAELEPCRLNQRRTLATETSRGALRKPLGKVKNVEPGARRGPQSLGQAPADEWVLRSRFIGASRQIASMQLKA